MSQKFLRIKEVCELLGIKRSTVWLWVKEGKLPQSIKLSPRVTVWRKSDLDEFIANAGGAQ